MKRFLGSVLPIIGYSDIDTVIADINANPKPLALYVWSYNDDLVQKVVTRTSSGGVCINHCLMQLVHGTRLWWG